MPIDSASNNVFRYVHFTPARLTEAVESQVRQRVERKRRRPADRGIPPRAVDEHQLRSELRAALRNLGSLDLTTDVELRQEQGGATLVTILGLRESGIAKLSELSIRTLTALGVDPLTTGYLQLVEAAEARLAKISTTTPAFKPGAAGRAPRVRAVGTAHLLVLKQQIKRYEAGEIAHIENVLAGEDKTAGAQPCDSDRGVFELRQRHDERVRE